MIFITARFHVKEDDADRWPQITAEFTAATRAEPGCLWFDWSRSVENSDEYVLVEAFRDADAGAAHVGSEHFARARQTLPPHLVSTPRIVSQAVDQDNWSELGELAVETGLTGSDVPVDAVGWLDPVRRPDPRGPAHRGREPRSCP